MPDEPRFALARTRALVALGGGLIASAIAAGIGPWQVAVMVGWSATSAVVLVWTIATIWPLDAATTAALATREDDSRPVADALLTSAAVASLVSMVFALVKASQTRGASQAAMTSLAILTVVLSWAMVHTVFTLRYAHLYFLEGRGIDFGDCGDPDYHDFAYVAFTIGMTFQVSDTSLTSKAIRRTALRHALLSYLFGAVVIALAINGVAGLLNR